jgi:hypothetical protein
MTIVDRMPFYEGMQTAWLFQWKKKNPGRTGPPENDMKRGFGAHKNPNLFYSPKSVKKNY